MTSARRATGPGRRRVRAALVTVVAGLTWLGGAATASAACHVASFVESSVSTDEGAGSVTLTIFLIGRQPNCEGTVDWATQDGSATAGEDYAAASGTVSFASGDDREEAITIELLDDAAGEGSEEFSVALSNPTGGISSTTAAAIVTIDDDDGAAPATDDAEPDADGDGASPAVPILIAIAVVGGIVAVVVRRR